MPTSERKIRLDSLRIITLMAIACLTAGAIAVPLAHASDDVDCSHLARWDSSKHYDPGSLVWLKVPNQNDGAEYKCIDRGYCGGSHIPPDKDSEWSLVGVCKFSSAPR